MQVRKVMQNKDRGPHQATGHPHRHFLHDHSPLLGFDHIWGQIPPSTGSSAYSTGSVCFLQETSCRTFGQAKIDLGGESEGWNMFVRPVATPVSTHHHMAPCSIALHLRHSPGYVFLHNHTRNPVFLRLTTRIFSDK